MSATVRDAEVVARVIFREDWETLSHTASVVRALDARLKAERWSFALATTVIIVGWLHDTLEDSSLDEKDLIDLRFRPIEIDAVSLLSREKGSPYEPYAERILQQEGLLGKVVRVVKHEDSRHNLKRCEAAVGVGKWQRLADERYRPLIAKLEERIKLDG